MDWLATHSHEIFELILKNLLLLEFFFTLVTFYSHP